MLLDNLSYKFLTVRETQVRRFFKKRIIKEYLIRIPKLLIILDKKKIKIDKLCIDYDRNASISNFIIKNKNTDYETYNLYLSRYSLIKYPKLTVDGKAVVGGGVNYFINISHFVKLNDDATVVKFLEAISMLYKFLKTLPRNIDFGGVASLTSTSVNNIISETKNIKNTSRYISVEEVHKYLNK